MMSRILSQAKCRLWMIFLLVFAIPVLAGGGPRQWINPAGGLWSNPANWMAGDIPDTFIEFADITIATTSAMTIVLDMDVSIAGFDISNAQSSTTVVVANQTMEILETVMPSNIGLGGQLDLGPAAGSRLFGPADIMIADGTLMVLGGNLDGPGALQVASGFGGLVFMGPDPKSINARTINVDGVVDWDEGDIALIDSPLTIGVSGFFTIAAQATLNGSGSSQLVNNGAINRDNFMGATQFQIPLIANGPIDLESGELVIDGPATFAGVTITSLISGANFRINADSDFNGCTFTGMGNFHLDSGMFSFTGQPSTIDASTQFFSGFGATYSGFVGLSNFATANLDNIQFTGNFLFSNQSGAILNLNNVAADMDANLTNDTGATVNWQMGDLTLDGNAVIFNSGDFNIFSVGAVQSDGSGAANINNSGIFTKTSPGNTDMNVPFVCDGTLNANNGFLRLLADFNNSGALNLSMPGGVELVAGIHTFESSSSVTGDGPFRFSGGTSSVDGVFTVNGFVEVNGGSASFVTVNTVGIRQLDLLAGLVGGTSDIAIMNVLNWQQGSLQTTGKMTVDAAGVVQMTTAGMKQMLNGQILEINGPANWLGGDLFMDDGSLLDIRGQFLIDNDLAILEGAGVPSQILNTGLVHKTTGPGNAAINVPFQNDGDLRVSAGTVTFFHPVNQAAGRTELVAANFNFQGGLNITGGELIGEGNIAGNTSLDGATLMPGLMGGAVGTLIFQNDLTFGTGVTTVFQIDPAVNPTTFDQIQVTGIANLDGTADILLQPGPFPQIGEVFPLLVAGALNGQFAPVNVPPGANGAVLQDSIVGTAFQVDVLAIPPPSNPQIFVADPMSQVVFLADPVNGVLNTSIDGLGDPVDLAVSPNGQLLAITNISSESITLVDTFSAQPLIQIPGFSQPMGSAFSSDNSQLWVLNLNIGRRASKRGPLPGFITIIDTTNFTTLGTVNDPCLVDIIAIANNPLTQQFYVLANSGTVCVFDSDGTFATSVMLPSTTPPTSMAVSPDGASVFISEFGTSSLHRFNALDFDTAVITLSNPPQEMDFNLDGDRLYIAADTDQILEIDTLQFAQINAIQVPGALGLFGMTVVPSVNLGFVTDPPTGTINSFTLDTLTVNPLAMGLGDPRAIADNDITIQTPGEVRFTQTTYMVNEGTPQALVEVERVGGFAGNATVVVTTADDSAIQGEDYQPVNQVVEFSNGEAGIKTIMIPIFDDAIIEQNERLTLNLATNDGATVIGTPNQAELIINDNEAGLFQFTQASYTVNEANGAVVLEIDRLGAPLGEVNLLVTTQADQAVGNFDFDATPVPVTFLDGEGGRKVATIPLTNDEFAENDEVFSATLQVIGGNGVLGSPTTAAITIIDDDAIEIAWSASATELPEPIAGKRAVSVSIRAQTNRRADFPIFFNYQVGGTATFGLDHDLAAGNGLIPIGQQSATIRFNILTDTEFENDETVILTLLNASVSIGQPNQWVLTILDANRRQPVPLVTILSPSQGSQWSSTTPVPFAAEVLLEGEATVLWEICASSGNCTTSTGDTFSLNLAPGQYQAICIATNVATGDVSVADKTMFEVVAGEPQATVQILAPVKNSIQVGVGDTRTFLAEASSVGDAPTVIEWLMSDAGEVLGTGNLFQTTFAQPGNFTIIARAQGATAANARDWRDVKVVPMGDRPPQVEIQSPADRSSVDMGEPLTFVGVVIDPDGEGREIPLTWDFGDGRKRTEAVVENLMFTQPGRYQIRLFGQFEDQRVSDQITLFVVNPGLGPLVSISPATDQRIHPFDPMIPNSGEVNFRPVIRNDRGLSDFDYFWDFGNGQTSQADVPGIIRYEAEGTFVATLVVKTKTGLSSPIARRTVIVARTGPTSFEPNNSFEQAVTLGAGQFPNLAVDDSGNDFFKIDIPRDDQTMVFRFFQNENAIVAIYDQNRQLIRTEMIGEDGSLQLVDLDAGIYFLRIQTPPTTKRLGISYGLAIDVLNPSLYFPEVESSPMMATELGVVNLSGTSTSMEAIGFDATGNLLKRVPLTLRGNGRIHLEMESLFSEDHRRVAWVEVDATATVIGYSRTSSRDGQELFAMTASNKRASSLFVPHIAEQVEQWFTRATVVNANQAPSQSLVETPGTQVPLALNNAYSQDRFEFVERFGGELPENGIWARLVESNPQVNLVGTEVFGTKDGTRQVAGLELLDNQEDNPNFVYVANNLYFTHIASDVETFYTGIALVNVGPTPQSVRVFAFRADGSRFGPKTMELGPNQKMVALADEFLEGVGSVSDTDWVMVEADSDIAGFEVFGTKDSKRLAGLEATHALQTELCYPYIDSSGNTFHGVSLINPNTAANPLTLTLYDDQGEVVASRQITLEAGQKLVATMEDLFPEAFAAGGNAPIPGWLGMKANLPTAGFELFTSKDNAQMGAILAQ